MDEISAAEYWARVEFEEVVRDSAPHPAEWEAALKAAIDAGEAEVEAALATGFAAAGRTLSDTERDAVTELLAAVWDASGCEFSSDQADRGRALGMLSDLAKSWAADPALTWALARWFIEIDGMDGPTEG